jgi:hypothetical protein
MNRAATSAFDRFRQKRVRRCGTPWSVMGKSPWRGELPRYASSSPSPTFEYSSCHPTTAGEVDRTSGMRAVARDLEQPTTSSSRARPQISLCRGPIPPYRGWRIGVGALAESSLWEELGRASLQVASPRPTSMEGKFPHTAVKRGEIPHL